MIVVTSVSPKHSNSINQFFAIESWRPLGKCFSLNSPTEIETLKSNYNNIEFVPTNKTIGHLVGKDLVAILAIIEFAIEQDADLFLINSDILVKDLPELKQDGITLFSRHDYVDDVAGSTKFENGFDAFYIPKQFLHLFPFSVYALGGTWHDYQTPFIAMKNNVPIYYPTGIFCYHKKHEVHYPMQDYFDIGEYFRWEHKLDKALTIPQIAAQSLAKIKENLISY